MVLRYLQLVVLRYCLLVQIYSPNRPKILFVIKGIFAVIIKLFWIMAAQHFEMISRAYEISYEKPQETTQDVCPKGTRHKAFLCSGAHVAQMWRKAPKKTISPSSWEMTYGEQPFPVMKNEQSF